VRCKPEDRGGRVEGGAVRGFFRFLCFHLLCVASHVPLVACEFSFGRNSKFSEFSGPFSELLVDGFLSRLGDGELLSSHGDKLDVQVANGLVLGLNGTRKVNRKLTFVA